MYFGSLSSVLEVTIPPSLWNNKFYTLAKCIAPQYYYYFKGHLSYISLQGAFLPLKQVPLYICIAA